MPRLRSWPTNAASTSNVVTSRPGLVGPDVGAQLAVDHHGVAAAQGPVAVLREGAPGVHGVPLGVAVLPGVGAALVAPRGAGDAEAGHRDAGRPRGASRRRPASRTGSRRSRSWVISSVSLDVRPSLGSRHRQRRRRRAAPVDEGVRDSPAVDGSAGYLSGARRARRAPRRTPPARPAPASTTSSSATPEIADAQPTVGRAGPRAGGGRDQEPAQQRQHDAEHDPAEQQDSRHREARDVGRGRVGRHRTSGSASSTAEPDEAGQRRRAAAATGAPAPAPAQTGIRSAFSCVCVERRRRGGRSRSGSRATDARRTASAQGRASGADTSSATARTSASTRARWTWVGGGHRRAAAAGELRPVLAEVEVQPLERVGTQPREPGGDRPAGRAARRARGSPTRRPSTTVGTPAASAKASSRARDPLPWTAPGGALVPVASDSCCSRAAQVGLEPRAG